MDDVKKRRILKIIGKISIIVVFIIAAIIVAKAHESWSDEAQSYLIARDNSFTEIFAQSKYEGTTPIWFIVIKAFIKLGGTYEMLFLLPLLFTVIGLIIFEFKIKAPWYIKLLLPFTYFIFYQYTIVARSYCMIFPALMFLTSIYNDRDKKRVLYCLAMLFLMSICSYTLVIAGSLLLIDIIQMIKQKRFTKENFATIGVIAAGLLITFLVLLPSPDCSFSPTGKGIFHAIYQATVGNFKTAELASVLVTLGFFAVVAFAISKEKKRAQKTIELLILFIPILAENVFLTSQIWHIGTITLLIYAAFMMNGMINTNKIIKVTLTIMCLVQIIWTLFSVKYDLNNNYSASKDVAEFIKQNNYSNIYGLGFDTVAIQPYFDHNIFKNYLNNKSYWLWSKTVHHNEEIEPSVDESAAYVISDLYINQFRGLYDALKEKGYQEHYFEGNMYTKKYIFETKGYYVLTK